MIELILATDMSKHAENLKKFKAVLAQGIDFSNEDHKAIVCSLKCNFSDLSSVICLSCMQLKKMLLKCCDISNEVRPKEISDQWLENLLEEYFQQSDKEKEEGLPFCSFMDRDVVTKPQAQIGFITFMLIPIFKTMAEVIDN